MMFFYFFKNIFEISTSKWSKNTKIYSFKIKKIIFLQNGGYTAEPNRHELLKKTVAISSHTGSHTADTYQIHQKLWNLAFPLGIFLSYYIFFFFFIDFFTSIICQECLSCVWWIAGGHPQINLTISFVIILPSRLQSLVGLKHFGWFCAGILDHWSVLLVKVSKWDCAFLQHPRN